MEKDEVSRLRQQLEVERAARLFAERRLAALSAQQPASAESAPADAHFLLDALMAHSPDHVYFKDRDSRILRVSRAMAALFGQGDPAKVIGKTDADFFTDEHARQARADELAIMQSGQPITVEEMETWPDRPPTWVSTTKAPLRDRAGNVIGTFGISRDISERRKMAQALAESETKFRDFFDKNSSMLLLLDPATGRILRANGAAAEFYGYTQKALEGMPMSEISVLSADDLAKEGQRAVREECNFFFFTHRLASGETRYVEVHLTPIETDGRLLLYSIVHDVTERRQAEDKLRLAATVFTHAREGILITTPDGTIIDVNDAFTDITGYGRDEALGRKPSMLASGRHEKRFYEQMWQALVENGQWFGEVWNRRKCGEVFAEMLTISAVPDANGQTQQYVGLFSDITRMKDHERELERVAHYDALTGLPNRVLFGDRLQQAMAQATRRAQRLAIAYLDLDGFKTINDRYGHEVGDRLLIAVAGRMKRALREEDTLARIGGDEFIAVLGELNSPGAAAGESSCLNCMPIFDRLLAAAAEPLYRGDLELRVSVSIGITFFPQADDVDAVKLVAQADEAMYEAKIGGKNRYSVFAVSGGEAGA